MEGCCAKIVLKLAKNRLIIDDQYWSRITYLIDFFDNGQVKGLLLMKHMDDFALLTYDNMGKGNVNSVNKRMLNNSNKQKYE